MIKIFNSPANITGMQLANITHSTHCITLKEGRDIIKKKYLPPLGIYSFVPPKQDSWLLKVSQLSMTGNKNIFSVVISYVEIDKDVVTHKQWTTHTNSELEKIEKTL